MHIYFSGIGGAGIGPLALIAQEAGYQISGSDANHSAYIDYLKSRGIDNVHIGQEREQIATVHAAQPIDWFVYSSALSKTNPNHPELKFCEDNGIKATKRDELLNKIIEDKNLKLIAIAGTHGKTTTTAMAVWVFKQLGLPVSYSVGAKLSFGDMGEFDPESKFFIYEADEYDRNFLNFYPEVALISGIDYDHPDVYPSSQSYFDAFRKFFDQSSRVVVWQDDADLVALGAGSKYQLLDPNDPALETIKLAGLVNRLDALLVARGLSTLLGKSTEELLNVLGSFPGVTRRFEQIAPNVYTDYAHTPRKIRGALQLAHEVAGDNVVVVYEGLHNLRQHFIKNELQDLFNDAKQLYIVPTYLAREDPNLAVMTPVDLVNLLSNSAKQIAHTAELNQDLKTVVANHATTGDLVLCLSAGGAGSLDEWLRKEFK